MGKDSFRAAAWALSCMTLACASGPIAAATAAADEGNPPRAAVITGQAGVNTALSAANIAANPQTILASPPPSCPAGLPTPTRNTIPACNLSSVTRPNVKASNGTAPACEGAQDKTYQQLVFLSTQVYRLMAAHASELATHMSCMLGVPLTPSHIIDALADMAGMICQGGANANRPFIVSCGAEEGAAAYFEGGLPYSFSPANGFAGSLVFRPNKLDALNASEASSASGADALRGKRFARQDFMDTLIHENTHALTSYLSNRYTASGASYSGNHSSCSVGTLTRSYAPKCGPSWDLTADPSSRFRYTIGTNQADARTYPPYMQSTYLSAEIPRKQAWIRAHQARIAPLLRKRDQGQPLSDAQQRQLDEWDAYSKSLADMQAQVPCAKAFEQAGPSAIMQDWDNPSGTSGCNLRPSSRFRDEVNARAVARILAGSDCQEADGFFFNSWGGVRDH